MNVEDSACVGAPTMLNGLAFRKDGVEYPSWLTLMVHPQGTSYLNWSEKPNKVVESHLRDSLETRVPLKFFLSDLACEGIDRRSENRGKQLPDILDTALKCQIAWYPLAKKYFDERGIALKEAYIDMLPNDIIYAVVFDAYNNMLTGDKAMSMTGAATDAHHIPCVVSKAYGICSQNSNSMKSSNPHSGIYEADTARTLDGNGGNPTCNQGGMAIAEPYIVIENHPNDSRVKISEDGTVQALTKRMGTGGNNVPLVGEPIAYGFYPQMKAECVTFTEDKACCLVNGTNPGYQNGVCTVYGLDRASFNQGANAKFDFSVEEDLAPTVVAKGPGAVATPTSNVFYAVRRLTPTECERLQGFPDGWTDIGEWVDSKGKKRKTSDANRYKALGNSIALPFWAWLIDRISARYDRKPTMCSLFDGISGFPLCWERTNGAGTCLWTSEIEEFPSAVAKKHFGDDDIGLKGDFEKYEKVGK